MAGIFINYRRDDSSGVAGRLGDRLAQNFSRRDIFMDVDAMKPGLDFVKQLDEHVAKCDVFLAVIGPSWLKATDEKGRRRLDLPRDYVRVELACALKREIPVIPVLVNGAAMPIEDDLPDDLKSLTNRHALELRHTRFAADSEAIIRALHIILPRTKWLRRWLLVPVALAVFLFVPILTFVGRFQMDYLVNCLKYGCELDYVTYQSQTMGVAFVYPRSHLTINTMHETEQRLPLFNHKGEVEVTIYRSALPSHRNPRQASADEQEALKREGNAINYVAPQIDPEKKDFYVVTGIRPDGKTFYFRRWYTVDDVVSAEYVYPPELIPLYHKVIYDMTVRSMQIGKPHR
jgi:hypothetical protein